MIETSSGLFELAAGMRQRADAVEALAREFQVFERNGAIAWSLTLYHGSPPRRTRPAVAFKNASTRLSSTATYRCSPVEGAAVVRRIKP